MWFRRLIISVVACKCLYLKYSWIVFCKIGIDYFFFKLIPVQSDTNFETKIWHENLTTGMIVLESNYSLTEK